MKARFLYRTASVLFALFAAMHTFGFLSFKPETAAGLAVRDAMQSVHFGPNLSYHDFYVGFGLYVSAYMVFSAILAWQLGTLASKYPQVTASLGWTLFAVQLASVALCVVYFGVPPTAFSAAVAICIGCASWLSRTAEPAAPLN